MIRRMSGLSIKTRLSLLTFFAAAKKISFAPHRGETKLTDKAIVEASAPAAGLLRGIVRSTRQRAERRQMYIECASLIKGEIVRRHLLAIVIHIQHERRVRIGRRERHVDVHRPRAHEFHIAALHQHAARRHRRGPHDVVQRERSTGLSTALARTA